VLEKVSGATTPAALHVRVLVSQLSLSPAICASVAQLQFALFGMCALADSPWTFVSSRQKDTFVSSCFSARCSSGCVPAQYSLTPVQGPARHIITEPWPGEFYAALVILARSRRVCPGSPLPVVIADTNHILVDKIVLPIPRLSWETSLFTTPSLKPIFFCLGER